MGCVVLGWAGVGWAGLGWDMLDRSGGVGLDLGASQIDHQGLGG